MSRYKPSRREILHKATVAVAAGSLAGRSLVSAHAQPANQMSVPGPAQVDAALRGAIGNKEIPGVVALAANDHDIIYEGAFGTRRVGQGPAMTRDTVFRVASMIKTITSVAAMQLVEQGKLALNEPVPELDPALNAPQVLEGFSNAGAPQLRPAKRPITLRHLLTHTSGFCYRLWDAEAVRYASTYNALPAKKRAARPRTPLMFDPGERWEYGTSIDWVGRLVEAISGQSIDVYFRENITGPLGMSDTGFVISAAQRAREASVHRRQSDGSLVPQPMEKPSVPKSFSGGGGIYSTAADYLTFIRMLLNDGSLNGARILRPDTVALMNQNQIGDIEAGHLKTTAPLASNDVDFFPGISLRWGLGHMINMAPIPDARSAGSLTWGGLFNTYYWIDPGKRVAGVFMTQVLPFADNNALRVYRAFERGIYHTLKAA
jgi:CubicO group peptidase (beta-lactamase class C family)